VSAYLLDTHAFMWWLDNDRRLGAGVRRVIEAANRVVVSDVSLWETAIKAAVGKFESRSDLESWFTGHLAAERFGPLAIERSHLVRVATLPMLHRDPFDRLLVAQAQTENLVMVTGDAGITRYEVETIW